MEREGKHSVGGKGVPSSVQWHLGGQRAAPGGEEQCTTELLCAGENAGGHTAPGSPYSPSITPVHSILVSAVSFGDRDINVTPKYFCSCCMPLLSLQAAPSLGRFWNGKLFPSVACCPATLLWLGKICQEACPDRDHAWWTPEGLCMGLWKLPLKPNIKSSSPPLGHFRRDTGWQGRVSVEVITWNGLENRTCVHLCLFGAVNVGLIIVD